MDIISADHRSGHAAQGINGSAVTQFHHTVMDVIIDDLIAHANRRRFPGCGPFGTHGHIFFAPAPAQTDGTVRHMVDLIVTNHHILHIAGDNGHCPSEIPAGIMNVVIGHFHASDNFSVILRVMGTVRVKIPQADGTAPNLIKMIARNPTVLGSVLILQSTGGQIGKDTPFKTHIP